MAAVDVAGFVTYLKDHSMEHGFHVHDERHFVETYSLRQVWEVDVHPADACGEPLDLHVALEIDPRTLLGFEDRVLDLDPDVEDPGGDEVFPLMFNWSLPPLTRPPDLLVLATDLAGIGGPGLPLEVAATDSYGAVTGAPERRLSIIGRVEVPLADIFSGRAELCDVLDRARDVSTFLLDRTVDWMSED